MARHHATADGDIPFTEAEELAADISAAESLAAEPAMRMDALRSNRNQLLAETDWTASTDVTMSAEMATYRQALRDLPANTVDVFNPVYPEKPE